MKLVNISQDACKRTSSRRHIKATFDAPSLRSRHTDRELLGLLVPPQQGRTSALLQASCGRSVTLKQPQATSEIAPHLGQQTNREQQLGSCIPGPCTLLVPRQVSYLGSNLAVYTGYIQHMQHA